MLGKHKIRVVVDEDAQIVARLDQLADAEGMSRADLVRRAIRRLLLATNSTVAINVPVELKHVEELVGA